MKQNKILYNVFRSTTLRLTVWYLIILMSLSIVFSIAIFIVTTNEIQARLTNFQTNIEESIGSNKTPSILTTIIHSSNDLRVADELAVVLFYVNLVILFGGGFLSYYLATRSLIPIKKVHESQSRFTSDTSHELRTPLAVMKTELEVALRDKNATVDDLRSVLSSNLEEVDKLSKLSEMLLNLSQLDNTKLKLSPVNLNKVTQSILNSLKIPKKRLELKSTKQQIVYGNETALSDSIKVLIDNSIQYSPNNSTVHVDISRRDDFSAEFVITNSGPGIQPEKLPHVFDRFYRADDSRTGGKNKGYGLGLALAKNIVELHNGTLSVESIPDQETTFTLVLPLHITTKSKTGSTST